MKNMEQLRPGEDIRPDVVPVRPPGGGTGGGTGGTTHPVALSTDTGNQDVPSAGSGQHMRSTASYYRGSTTVSGQTHIWCTNWGRGFHGSAVPILFDANGGAIWPRSVQEMNAQKHQYGVDGTALFWSTSDRVVPWVNTVPADVVAKNPASIAVTQWLDPKNMLVEDIGIVGKTLPAIIAIIAAL